MEIFGVAADPSGTLLTGKAAFFTLRVRRVSDGLYLDFTGSPPYITFSATPAVPTIALDEVSATYAPGEYKKALTITAWTDGFYQALAHFDDGTTVLNFSSEKYIIGGKEVDSIFPIDPADESLLESAITNKTCRIFIKIP